MSRPASVFALLSLAISLIGCYASPSPEPDIVIPRLIVLLQHPDPHLRQTAALSLGKIAPEEAAPALVRALRDTDPLVRRYSAWALGNMEEKAGPDAASALLQSLEDPIPDVVDAAARAIGKVGADPTTLARLEAMLKTGELHIRRAAVRALGWLESSTSYAALLSALEDRDPGVRQEAIGALGELGDRRAIPAIEARLRHDTAEGVRAEAAYRLGTLGDERSLPLLRAVGSEDPSPNVRRWAKKATTALSAPDEPG